MSGLRLVHRVAERASHLDSTGRPKILTRLDTASRIASSHIVVADNVAEYMAEGGRAERYSSLRDINFGEDRNNTCLGLRCVPLDSVFVEWVNPPGLHRAIASVEMCGVIFRRIDKHSIEARHAGFPNITDDSIAFLMSYAVFAKGAPDFIASHHAMVFNQQRTEMTAFKGGIFKRDGTFKAGSGAAHSSLNLFTYFMLDIAATALAFMSCNNVVKRDATEELGPSRKWLKRTKQPEIRYHVLDINPMKEVLRTEGNIEANGLKKAMHICRGHFVTYSEEKPLFGRLSGTFWKPAHVRGSVENGIVDKDYRIRLNVAKPVTSQEGKSV